MIESLASAIAKPPREDNIQSRGRRLLALIGWIRDESFRFVQDWDNAHAREIVSDRIVAVSAFIQDDIDSLRLRQEYDAVERVVLEAAEKFRHIRRDHDRGIQSDLHTELSKLVDGVVLADSDVWRALLHVIKRDGFGRYPYPYFRRWSRPNVWMDWGLRDWYSYLRYRRGWHSYLRSANDWYNYFRRWDWYNYWDERPVPNRPMLSPLAWATGVAEAATVFRGMLNQPDPLRSLRNWSKQFVPRLNKSIVTFERSLHEKIFGKL
jgi:hypothetical protein